MKANIYLCLPVVALALTGPSANGQVVLHIPTVVVGNAGNAADTTGYGSVNYNYHIGTYPVTNLQYTTFLNAVATLGDPHGLWNANMGSSIHGGISRSGSGTAADPFLYSVRTPTEGINAGQSMGNRPVNFVGFWDAARFTNWLSTGNTETGVYILTSEGIANNTITRDATAWANGGVAIASENEWYKAAYYSPALNGGSGGYWLYPTQSSTAPTAMGSNDTDANSANFARAVNTVTDVGSYTVSNSYYGTFDQGGNVWEWNEEIISTSRRGVRGGSYASELDRLQSSFRNFNSPDEEFTNFGFRVSSLAPIPEPSTYAAILGLLAILIAVRCKRRGTRLG